MSTILIIVGGICVAGAVILLIAGLSSGTANREGSGENGREGGAGQ